MSATFAGCIGVKSTSSFADPVALTTAFSLTCMNTALNGSNVGSYAAMTNVAGTNANMVPVPATTASAAGQASNFKGYYYLCPVNKGWWQQPTGNACGGIPMRGFTVQNGSTSPFIPDGDLTDADVNYASSNLYNQIVLLATAGTNSARFAIIDLYGIVIPSAVAV